MEESRGDDDDDNDDDDYYYNFRVVVYPHGPQSAKIKTFFYIKLYKWSN